MKLIIKQYLSSLREREELDAIIPDLLSQIGLNVFSRPGRGTRQDGVDVAAVGSLDGKEENVYLFSIKSGDLTRSSWDGGSPQALRPSLNEILDTYIPNRLPVEHKDKEIVICLCFGGDILEQVRPQVEGYINNNTKDNISFEEWNGDKLSSKIIENFLREDLLPENTRPLLRKALAMIDEPETSYRHFSSLINSVISFSKSTKNAELTTIRQLNICLWILFSWGREENNIESAYLASETTLLNAWNISKKYFKKNTKSATEIRQSFLLILSLYQQICAHYVDEKIIPHTGKLHALSFAVRSSCYLDVNLRLFDVLGRISMNGLWAYWSARLCEGTESDSYGAMVERMQKSAIAVIELINNNPALFLPIKDDQSIDISIALLLLAMDQNCYHNINSWLTNLINKAKFAFHINAEYPCHLTDYSRLLEHPQNDRERYLEEVTSASILFPVIALWAALLGFDNLYNKVKAIKVQYLEHCNFQFWYPDETSEDHFYTNSDAHGATLSQINLEMSPSELELIPK